MRSCGKESVSMKVIRRSGRNRGRYSRRKRGRNNVPEPVPYLNGMVIEWENEWDDDWENPYYTKFDFSATL